MCWAVIIPNAFYASHSGLCPVWDGWGWEGMGGDGRGWVSPPMPTHNVRLIFTYLWLPSVLGLLTPTVILVISLLTWPVAWVGGVRYPKETTIRRKPASSTAD